MGPRPDEPLPVVPDDAAELDADRLAWLAEERTERRRSRMRRLVLTRRWEKFGLSGPLVVLALLATSVVGALVVAFTPRIEPLAAAAALAPTAALAIPARDDAAARTAAPAIETATDAPPRTVAGFLLPDVALEDENSAIRSPSIRPALIAVVPAGCACQASIGALLRQAHEFRLRLWLIETGRPGARAELVRLDEAARGAARWAVDGSGGLERALLARGLTIVLVRADGVIHQVRRDLGRDGRIPALELQLARLAPAADRTSNR